VLFVCLIAAFAAIAVPAVANCGACDTAPCAVTPLEAYPKNRLYMSDAGYYRWQQFQATKAWMSFKDACAKIAASLTNGN
jgi:hypothetical protein